MGEHYIENQTDVLICFDNHYAPAASVMLTSLFLNNKGVKFNLFAIVNGVAEKRLETISKLCENFFRTVSFVVINKSEYEVFHISHHFSHEAYFRLFAPNKIRANKILYLELDLIVQTNICPLLEMDIKDNIIAGSLDRNPSEASKERLGLDVDEPYINTGVLLMNLEHWRSQMITQRLITYYGKHKHQLKWADQDLLNKILAGKKFVVDQQWNMLYGDLINGKFELSGFDRDSFKGIFHFNADTKPWHNRAKQPYSALYQKYANLAPTRMPESSIPRKLYKILKLTKNAAREGKRKIKSMFWE
jgi:lipopolysaccharide biosynthesis glycosyltransferase